ncbi:MAG TPA: hypothetical protein VNC50_15370 [Planctomycetia bacterium]|nr:hypothetical protein [Planctomycetia bacterium]
MKYIAELPHVREVSLAGRADLGFWTARLASEGLEPIVRDGRASLLVSSPDSSFRGIPFCEFAVAVEATREQGAEREPGYYLAGAFNSSRLLACMERTFFSTPYHHNRVRIEVGPPAVLEVNEEETVFRAAMKAGPDATSRPPVREAEEWWAGPLFLPGDPRRPAVQRWFAARIGGLTRAWPFLPGDEFRLRPSRRHPMLGWLIESGFEPAEWLVRPDALHARTKTWKRRRQ